MGETALTNEQIKLKTAEDKSDFKVAFILVLVVFILLGVYTGWLVWGKDSESGDDEASEDEYDDTTAENPAYEKTTSAAATKRTSASNGAIEIKGRDPEN